MIANRGVSATRQATKEIRQLARVVVVDNRPRVDPVSNLMAVRDDAVDGNHPEEWIASSVKALNQDSTDPMEGLSIVRGTGVPFAALMRDSLQEMTGGEPFDVLVKVLDSAVRLPAQAHPDKAFSRKHFKSEHGKTEMWLVLATRPRGLRPADGCREGGVAGGFHHAVVG